MKQRNVVDIEKRMLNLKESAAYIGMGTTFTRKLMDSIGATRHIGKRVIFDKVVIDDYLNKAADNGGEVDVYGICGNN